MYEKFIEQVKYIAGIRAGMEQKGNTQTLYHAYCVDPGCVGQTDSEVFQRAHEFVDLMIARGSNGAEDDKSDKDCPKWLKYKR